MLHTQAEMLPTTSVTRAGYVIGSTKIHHSSLNQGVASVSLLSLIPDPDITNAVCFDFDFVPL